MCRTGDSTEYTRAPQSKHAGPKTWQCVRHIGVLIFLFSWVRNELVDKS